MTQVRDCPYLRDLRAEYGTKCADTLESVLSLLEILEMEHTTKKDKATIWQNEAFNTLSDRYAELLDRQTPTEDVQGRYDELLERIDSYCEPDIYSIRTEEFDIEKARQRHDKKEQNRGKEARKQSDLEIGARRQRQGSAMMGNLRGTEDYSPGDI